MCSIKYVRNFEEEMYPLLEAFHNQLPKTLLLVNGRLFKNSAKVCFYFISLGVAPPKEYY